MLRDQTVESDPGAWAWGWGSGCSPLLYRLTGTPSPWRKGGLAVWRARPGHCGARDWTGWEGCAEVEGPELTPYPLPTPHLATRSARSLPPTILHPHRGPLWSRSGRPWWCGSCVPVRALWWGSRAGPGFAVPARVDGGRIKKKNRQRHRSGLREVERARLTTLSAAGAAAPSSFSPSRMQTHTPL